MCASQPHAHLRARLRRRPRGFTLPEAILAIVVLGVGLAGLLLAFATVAKSSADPVLQQQMMAVAQELLEEIQLKPYAPAANGLGDSGFGYPFVNGSGIIGSNLYLAGNFSGIGAEAASHQGDA